MVGLNAEGRGFSRTLANGAAIPQLGFGVWQVPDGRECERAIRWALECGYRLIDTAQAYGNETSVGRAIRDSGIAREEIFLTTKFYPGRRDPTREAADSLARLDSGYIDLYLVHWPQDGATWAWPGMEAAVASDLVKSIGVSNFGRRDIEAVVQIAQVRPAVNQIQVSPFEYRRRLIDKSESEGLIVQAYSPLGTGRHLTEPVVEDLASRLHRTPAQVLIRWGIQKGLSVVTKSTHQARIEENANVFDFELDRKSIEELDLLDTTGRADAALAPHHRWWT
jgi:diketogulonate reductase-like aldo/keto reductase